MRRYQWTFKVIPQERVSFKDWVGDFLGWMVEFSVGVRIEGADSALQISYRSNERPADGSFGGWASGTVVANTKWDAVKMIKADVERRFPGLKWWECGY